MSSSRVSVPLELYIPDLSDARLTKLAEAIEEERSTRKECRRTSRRAKALLQKYRIRR